MESDRQAILRVFQEEAEEHLGMVETGLIALESRPDDRELLEAVFRSAHTLKGNASIVGFQAIIDLSHVLEAVLDRWMAGTLAVERAHITLLLRCVDRLRAMAPAAVLGDESMPADARWLIAAIEDILDVPATGPRPETAVPVEAAPAAPAAIAAPAEPIRDTHLRRTLRVDIGRLDRMMNLTAEITIARGRVTAMLENLDQHRPIDVLEAHREVEHLQLELQELIMKIRLVLVPVGPLFRQYIRTVRDLAETHGKLATLTVEGEDVEVDPMVLEQIRDPLTHLLRNAIDHGIEAPEERRAALKDPRGAIVLRARRQANSIAIQVSDDGAGLRRERIVAHARERGLLSRDPEEFSDEEIQRLIFRPGFSTAEQVSDLSGRGIGMDVVRKKIEALRGSIAIDTRPGHGTTFTLKLPHTLPIIEGFSVGAGDETYVLPLDAVTECLDIDEEAVIRDEGRGVVNLRGEALPYVRLRALFDIAGTPPERENIVVVQHNGRRAGIAVDALYGESQTVIKPLGRLFQHVQGVTGSTLLGNGRVALILDVGGILDRAYHSEAEVAS